MDSQPQGCWRWVRFISGKEVFIAYQKRFGRPTVPEEIGSHMLTNGGGKLNPLHPRPTGAGGAVGGKRNFLAILDCKQSGVVGDLPQEGGLGQTPNS
jgi:hypothetical protein